MSEGVSFLRHFTAARRRMNAITTDLFVDRGFKIFGIRRALAKLGASPAIDLETLNTQELEQLRINVASQLRGRSSSNNEDQTMKSKMFRQGDVLIEPVAAIPADAVKQKASGRIILAHGEATGHHHSVDIADADWWKRDNGEQFIEVKSGGAAVEHQEHSAIDLPPGKYAVRRQREYTPEAIRNVQD